MKKYLIIGDGESPHILKWVKELNKHFEVYLVSSRNTSPGVRAILADERIFTFNMKLAEAGGNFRYIRMLFPVKKIIKKIRPDYVNAHYVTSHGLIAALVKKLSGRKFRLITTAWGTDVLVTPYRNWFFRSITRFALKQANLVTTDSKSAADAVKQFCKTAVTTFPFGLEKLPEIAPGEKERNLFFSNRTLNANSNIDRVLHFFSKILEKEPSSELIIGNDGPLKDEMKSICREMGISDRVTFVGFISTDEQNEYYRRASFFFSVLTTDALSVSLLEAMAFGCIPLVSDLHDNTDWVKDGENGLVLSKTSDPYDLIKLREEQERIFNHNRDMIHKKAIFPDAIEEYCRIISLLK